jgi:hypothetical protein
MTTRSRRIAFSIAAACGACLLGAVVAACASPPDAAASGAKESAIDAPPARSGSDTTASSATVTAVTLTDGGTSDSAASGAKCAELTGAACQTCCAMEWPDIDSALSQLFTSCLCQSPGECATECGATYCTADASATPPDACKACVNGSSVCAPAAMAVCMGDPGCSAYAACFNACK